MKQEATATLAGLGVKPAPAVSFFEYWPGWLFYTPVVLHWIALGIRYGSFTLPTAANPCVETGGLAGERKTDILDKVEGAAREWVAPYVVTRTGGDAEAATVVAVAAMAAAGLDFPVVAKPDVGCNGTGVRLVRTLADLRRCYADFPPDTALLLQELVELPGEAGLFYVRLPGEARGRITSVTLKTPPVVVGDGRHTLRELVLADPRYGAQPQLYLRHLQRRLVEVPAAGERVQIVFVGNHCKGSTFADGRAHATAELTARLDGIAKAIPGFAFGRFDVRYGSVAELRQGRNFRIIEVNGVGAEATHIWDPATRLVDAYRAQFEHYGAAFRIGAANRKLGVKPTPGLQLLRDWLRQRRVMASYPLND